MNPKEKHRIRLRKSRSEENFWLTEGLCRQASQVMVKGVMVRPVLVVAILVHMNFFAISVVVVIN